jgi:hypothetical protein
LWAAGSSSWRTGWCTAASVPQPERQRIEFQPADGVERCPDVEVSGAHCFTSQDARGCPPWTSSRHGGLWNVAMFFLRASCVTVLPPPPHTLYACRTLLLSGCQLSGPIPSALFAGVGALATLDLSKNLLAGSLPSAVLGLSTVGYVGSQLCGPRSWGPGFPPLSPFPPSACTHHSSLCHNPCRCCAPVVARFLGL